MIWWTADTHAYHANVIRHCNRPWLRPGDIDEHGQWVSKEIANARGEEMTEALAANWNEDVKSGDDVYIVGDFAWKMHGRFLAKLRGRKHLLLGSHDKMSQEELKNFTSVCQILKKDFDGKIIVACHWPMRTWDQRARKSLHVFGHVHNRLKNSLLPRTMDVGIDCNDKRPYHLFSMDEVFDHMKQWDDVEPYASTVNVMEDPDGL